MSTTSRNFFGYQGFYRGIAKFSVPTGHYSATCIFFTLLPGDQYSVQVVTLPQFTVNGDSSVTLDARKATSRVTVTTPRPATTQSVAFDLGRTDAKGAQFNDLLLNDGDAPISASPTPAVTVGRFNYSVYWRRGAADDSYTYDLEMAGAKKIPAKLHYAATPGQLATAKTRYFSEAARTGAETRYSFLPWEDFLFRTLFDLPQPKARTEYVTGNPNITWAKDVITVFDPVAFSFVGELYSSDRAYLAGQKLSEDWNAQPMHPAVFVDLMPHAANPFSCQICRTGDLLNIDPWPISDNQPGHVGFPSTPVPGLTESLTFALYQNGHLVDPDPVTGEFIVTPAAANYRVVIDAVRKAPYFTVSTNVHTEWTFKSSHADGSGTLPAGWFCFDFSTNCAVAPLLMARYDLPLSLSDKHAAGATTFGLTVDHLQGAAAKPTTSATVSVSYNDGATWVPATVTGHGGGHYTIGYTTPSKGSTNGYVAIRISATDAAGGTLNQTVLRAYALS